MSIVGSYDSRKRVRCKFSRAECIINSFASKRLHHAGGVSNKKEIFMCAGNERTCEWGDGTPGLIGGNFEMALRPLPQPANRRRDPHEAKIELGFVHWSLTGVTFAKKLQYDALAEVLWQR